MLPQHVFLNPFEVPNVPQSVGSRCNKLQLERDKQTDNRCKKSNRLDKSRDDQHGRLDATGCLRLTSDTFHGTATDATDTQTGTDCRQTSTDTGTHYC